MAGTKLYVGNLNYQTTEEGLKEAFGQFGEVVSVTIVGGRGFGFVELTTPEAAQNAVDGLNGTELDGRMIRVSEALSKPRSGGGGDRGGRGGERGGRSDFRRGGRGGFGRR